MSSRDICDIDHVTADEKVNDYDTEVVSEKDSDLDLSDHDGTKSYCEML